MTQVEMALQYCRDIVSGDIVAGKYVKLAAKRFLDDLERDDWRWEFVPEYAEKVMTFSGFIKFIEGPVAGQPLTLSNWQRLYFCAAYGWVDKDDHEVRRFKELVTMIGRKNAKSTLLAVHGIYELLYGPEGSQIFSVATTRDQAKLVWGMADRMMKQMDNRLVPGVRTTYGTLSNENNWARWVPQSRESKRQDGLNARFVIVDEAAAIEDRNVIEVLTSSMGNQKSPQVSYITTAQDIRDTYFYELMEHSQRVLDGLAEDDRLFSMLYALDEEEEWDQPDVWVKANPNLGISVSEEFLQEELQKAKALPSAKANFLIKYCNLFVSTTQVWIPREIWDKHSVERAMPQGSECFLGVDLANTQDLNVVCSLFPLHGEDQFYADFQCWVPEGTYNNVPKHLKQVYRSGVETGILSVTPGDIMDHTLVKDYIVTLGDKYKITDIGYDSHGAASFMMGSLYQDSYPTTAVSQGMVDMSPASKELENHIFSGRITHNGDVFTSWQIGNTVIYTDVNGNIKPRKGDDHYNKVDSTIALIMALSVAIDHGGLMPMPEITEASFSFG